MVFNMKGKHVTSILDLSREEIEQIFDTAQYLKMKNKLGEPCRPLEGKTLGMIFQKSSTRTRISFEVGMWQLGGYALYMSSNDLQLNRGETIDDTAATLNRYLDGIMIRSYDHQDVINFAGYCTIPIINGLTDGEHPCQALTDLFTIREKKGSLAGLKLAYVGDGNNVANSLLFAAAKTGMHMSIGCPPGYEPEEPVINRARHEAQNTGSILEINNDPFRAVEDADIVYTDVWISMGMEDEKEKRIKEFAPYQVNEDLLENVNFDALVMHCLPAHRDKEIAAEVIDGPRSIVFDQAENRLHLQKALLALIM